MRQPALENLISLRIKHFHQNRFMHRGAMRKVRFVRYISVIMKRSAQWTEPLKGARWVVPEWVNIKKFWLQYVSTIQVVLKWLTTWYFLLYSICPAVSSGSGPLLGKLYLIESWSGAIRQTVRFSLQVVAQAATKKAWDLPIAETNRCFQLKLTM